MQQLEFWFADRPSGFYKFLSPCPNNEKYKKGDSWIEELAFSADEFRTAFDSIGVRYKSKKDYSKKAPEVFQGKYYCSYFDKIKGLTYYFRNHELVDKLLARRIRILYQPPPFLTNKISPVTLKTATLSGRAEVPPAAMRMILDVTTALLWVVAI